MTTDIRQELCVISGMDWEETLNRFMNNENLYEKILSKFPEDLSFDNLKKKMEVGDLPASFTYAHTLKGVAGNLGLAYLFETASLLTEQLRLNSVENAPALMEKLTAQYEAVCNVIRKMKP